MLKYVINLSIHIYFLHRDFLPRGNGICTRRPLVLQLYNTGNGSAGDVASNSNRCSHTTYACL